MPESESEDEILERIEIALRKIAGLAQPAKPPAGPEFDREAVARSLDTVIEHLRAGLDTPGSTGQTE
ncbi:hypothetical protein [Acidocella sp.]|uniref:hypothetical protein n=1 Tax=Acidocella sp. TaxID=50710 RepID=UPI00262CC1BA|nr:hypothetical protein [Acidocella sp.]MDD2795596.1 hypothetical protein [Acidocella sp.]